MQGQIWKEDQSLTTTMMTLRKSGDNEDDHDEDPDDNYENGNDNDDDSYFDGSDHDDDDVDDEWRNYY